MLRTVRLCVLAMLLASSTVACKRTPAGSSARKAECRGTLGKDELYRLQERLEKGENVCPELTEPRIEIGPSGVTLDGEKLGGGPPAAGISRYEPLFVALKSGRETWKMIHPGDAFEPVVTIVAAPEVGAGAGASIVSTAVHAGYAGFEVQASSVELRFHSLLRPRDVPPPPEVLRVARGADAKIRVRFAGRTSPRVGLDETVPLAELGRMLATECAKSTDACVDEIVIEVGGGTFRELAELAQAVVRAPALASRRIPLSFEAPEPKRDPPDAGADPPRASKARIRVGVISVTGPLEKDVVEKVVRDGEPAFRRCYERVLATNPNLQGRVSARFVVGRDGSVHSATNGGSDLPDSGVVSCVMLAYGRLRFPKPEKTIATVASPLMFTPD